MFYKENIKLKVEEKMGGERLKECFKMLCICLEFVVVTAEARLLST